MGDPQVTTTPERPRGAMLRAYDKADRQGSRRGLDAGAAERLADDLHVDGKQYIVVAVSGGSYSGEYIAVQSPELSLRRGGGYRRFRRGVPNGADGGNG